jgi:ABC-type antimicrobial peptide transport system permease subunit
MFKNYFTTAFRNFWRNKAFSTINVLGLSIGISAALVIFLIVYYEFSFDKFEKYSNRIYRVVLDAKFNGNEGHSTGVQAPLSNAIQNEVTGVDETVPVMQFQGDATAKVSIVKKTSSNPLIFKKQQNIIFTNQQYFQLLNYKFISGSPGAAMKGPFSVVLTESRSQQYFPGVPAQDIIGRQITYNDNLTAVVSGVVKDLNEQTVFTAAEFISFATIAKTHLQKDFMMDVWNDWMAYSQVYIKLSKGITPGKTEVQLKNLLNKYNKDANRDEANTMAFHLQPLDDIHFNNKYPAVGGRIADKSTLYGLSAIAAFLLLLACINFINLTTAQASHRAKEIGIRKTMGSSKKNLVFQFLMETFFITVIATILSIIVTPFLLKMFEDFIPQGLHFDLLHQPYLILFLLLLTIAVSFLSGLYPALILSGFRPALVLKNQAFTGSAQSRNAWVRKTLTVSQFVIAQFFVIATIMLSKQINYSINTDMGFNTKGIINFETPRDTVTEHNQQLLHAINAIPEVAMASTGFFAPADEGVAYTNISYEGRKDLKANVQIRWGDPNYIKIYQIKLLAGRNVEPSDTMKEFIINNTYAKLLGFQEPEDALGKQLNFNGKNMPVIGVMQDFHELSTHGLIDPLVFAGNNGSTFHILLKPNGAEGIAWKNGISKIQKAYKKIYPEADFNYNFFDEKIAKLYEREQHTANLLQWSTGLTILISCLGLLGLVIFTTNSRTKEIGVRKVLGASVGNIISILSKDFIQLVLIAFVIAAPIAWWTAYKWLQDFAYRTNMSWWIFALSGIAMIIIALLTLSIQTIKSAIANPVKSLRTE